MATANTPRDLAIFGFASHNDATGELSLLSKQRLEHAAQMWKTESADTGRWRSVRVFVSAAFGVHFNRSETPLHRLQADYLIQQLHVPAEYVVVHTPLAAIRNTCEEVMAWDAILRDPTVAGNIDHLRAFTHPFHAPRARHLMSRMARVHADQLTLEYIDIPEVEIIEVEDGGAVDTTTPNGGGSEEHSKYTNKSSDFLPMGKCPRWQMDIILEYEAKGLEQVANSPYGAWKEWMDAHP